MHVAAPVEGAARHHVPITSVNGGHISMLDMFPRSEAERREQAREAKGIHRPCSAYAPALNSIRKRRPGRVAHAPGELPGSGNREADRDSLALGVAIVGERGRQRNRKRFERCGHASAYVPVAPVGSPYPHDRLIGVHEHARLELAMCASCHMVDDAPVKLVEENQVGFLRSWQLGGFYVEGVVFGIVEQKARSRP